MERQGEGIRHGVLQERGAVFWVGLIYNPEQSIYLVIIRKESNEGNWEENMKEGGLKYIK